MNSLVGELIALTPLKKLGESFGVGEPRAVIDLSAGSLKIREHNGEGNRHYERTWPADQLTECRPNRYQRSLYLRVPGKEVWDALGELDEELLRFVADTLRPYLPNVPPAG